MRTRTTLALALTLGLLIAPGANAEEAAPKQDAREGEAAEKTSDEPTSAEKTAEKSVEAKSPGGVDEASGSADELRVKLEQGISEIGQIAAEVREEDDPRKLACVVDKQERAQIVMERATTDILAIEGGDAQARSFAREKLAASAERMDKLVELARRCQGVEDGGRPESETANTYSDPSKVPHNDPTKDTPGNGPFPLPQDPGRGPVSSAVR